MVDIGTEEGTFETTENRIIQNLIKLRSVKAEDVMTPRVVVATAPEEMNMSEFPLNKHYLHFSRIPVYSGNMENITGFVYRQDVFENLANDRFCRVYAYEATMTPKSPLDFMGNDFIKFDLEGTLVTPYGYDHPFKIDYFDELGA